MKNSDFIENFINILKSTDKCFTYEFSTPCSFSLESYFSLFTPELLKHLDAFVCTDSPLAKLKHNASLASLKLQNTFNIPSITTMSMRDKNTLALQSEIIGMNSLDLRLILSLTGDSPKLGNQPQCKGVFEGNSTLLLKLIASLNRKQDINSQNIHGEHKTIYGFSVLNSYSNKKESLYKKMKQKIMHGAQAIFTQPVYDLQIAKELVAWNEEINKTYNTNAILMLGFFPITSYKTALFLHNKLPGVHVPTYWLESLKKAQDDNNEEIVGLQKSKNLFESIKAFHPKIHLMSANKPQLIQSILND